MLGSYIKRVFTPVKLSKPHQLIDKQQTLTFLQSSWEGAGAAMSYIEEALEKAKALAKQAKLSSDIPQVCLYFCPSLSRTSRTTRTPEDVRMLCCMKKLGFGTLQDQYAHHAFMPPYVHHCL